MILDYGNEFTSNPATSMVATGPIYLGTTASTAVAGSSISGASGKWLDAGVVGQVIDLSTGAVGTTGTTIDWGAGECIFPYVRITIAPTGSSYTGSTFEIIGTSDVTDGNPGTTLSTSGSIAKANLTANTLIPMPPLKAGQTKYRYLICKVTNAGAAPDTGAFVCGLVDEGARPQNSVNTL
jgi:hypothetical protein